MYMQEGHLMVLYDLEERLAVSIGTLWYEKGIDNFVVLSGMHVCVYVCVLCVYEHI
jgi:hypothetical protein